MKGSDEFREKLGRARTFVASTSVPMKRAFPPVYEFLWKRNFKIRPPLFQVWWKNALILGIGWSGFLALMMFPWLRESQVLRWFPLACVVFGMMIATSWEVLKGRIAAPRWEEL